MHLHDLMIVPEVRGKTAYLFAVCARQRNRLLGYPERVHDENAYLFAGAGGVDTAQEAAGVRPVAGAGV